MTSTRQRIGSAAAQTLLVFGALIGIAGPAAGVTAGQCTGTGWTKAEIEHCELRQAAVSPPRSKAAIEYEERKSSAQVEPAASTREEAMQASDPTWLLPVGLLLAAAAGSGATAVLMRHGRRDETAPA
jgi:hypothetical protein